MKTIKQIIEAHKKGEKIDLDSIDFTALGVPREQVVYLLETIPLDTKEPKTDGAGNIDWTKVDIPEEVLKKASGQLITDARKEEKETLYASIEKLKDSNKTLIQFQEESRQKAADIEKAKSDDAEKEKMGKLDAKQAIEESAKKFEALLAEQQTTHQSEISNLRASFNRQELTLHREKLLAVGGDAVIPEMIRGNTIEELNGSFEMAQKVVKDIREKEAQKYLAEAETQKKGQEAEALRKKEEEAQKSKSIFNPGGVGSIINPRSSYENIDTANITERIGEAKTVSDLSKVKEEILGKYGM